MRARGIVLLLIGATFALVVDPAWPDDPRGQGLAHVSAVPHRLSLRAQARALYAAVLRYERSTSPAQRARVHSATVKDGRRIDACQAPYFNRLRLSRRPGANQLFLLYENGAGMEQAQRAVAPVSKQLTALAQSWQRLRLANRAMNDFAHGLAAEFDASLKDPRLDVCAFIRDIAAHHFSYSWARRSPAGQLVDRFETGLLEGADRTNRFWRFVGASSPRPRLAPGAKLFTSHDLVVLANLPGEAG